MENEWVVYPAIDLRRGRVVRLRQGDPDQETRYAEDPLSVARRWQEAGATWLHVVNLDGAFDEGGRENQAALERILTTGLQVQFGGGVRDLTTLCRALDLGVSRVVIGTAAVRNPELVDDALRTFGPDRILYGTDNPVFYMRGRRQWRGREYINRTNVDFYFNKEREPAEVEAGYTLYMYEALRAIKSACDDVGVGPAGIESIFHGNAARLISQAERT